MRLLSIVTDSLQPSQPTLRNSFCSQCIGRRFIDVDCLHEEELDGDYKCIEVGAFMKSDPKKHQLEHSDEVLANIHDASQCLGQNCTIHNLSNHHMREFPQHWRSDRGIMERICPHGVGHPDPDNPWPAEDSNWIHGCDGCCSENSELAPSETQAKTRYETGTQNVTVHHSAKQAPKMSKEYEAFGILVHDRSSEQEPRMATVMRTTHSLKEAWYPICTCHLDEAYRLLNALQAERAWIDHRCDVQDEDF